ncbi:MAG: hypothetical protein QNL01_05395 [Akkermansiaceae bacterium]|jgi:hypothetical protein|tara:strand:- start:976 stop:1239 length:264 start_codon:yes stop_codon:yes gene_type:complete
MAKWANDSGEVSIKIAVIGQPGSGKGSILRHLATSQGQAAVRTGVISETEVVRTEFIWTAPPLLMARLSGLRYLPFLVSPSIKRLSS